MQLVVADANVLLAGLIDPESIYRKLLLVFAWGKLHADLDSAKGYREEIEQLLAENPGARFGGQPDPDEVVRLARERIALLEEHLPAMTPNDWGLVTSHPITKEVHDVCLGGRSGFGPLPDQTARAAVATAVSVSTTQVIHGLDRPITDYTQGRDPDDDRVIHTAILAGCASEHRWAGAEPGTPSDHSRQLSKPDAPSGRASPPGLIRAVGPKGDGRGDDDPEELGLALAEVPPAGDAFGVGHQHLAVPDRRREAGDADLDEALGDGDDPAPLLGEHRFALFPRREPDEVDPQIRAFGPENRHRALRPMLGALDAATDPVDVGILAANQVVDRHPESGREPGQRGEGEPALAALGLRDGAAGHPGELGQLVLIELPRPAQRPQ